MSLIICPECGHEVSTTATACPNCGYQFMPPVVHPPVQRNVVISEVPREREGFPPWAFIPLGVLALGLIFLFFFLFKSNDNGSNINVNLAARTSPVNARETTIRSEPPTQIVVPPSSEPQQVIVPPAAPMPPSSSETTVTTVAPETVAPDKGTVDIEAKIATKSGAIEPVQKEKFYLLDKDLQSILSDADIQDETGQGLNTAFGLSVVYPDKYRETNKKSLDAINKHVKYDVLTDASGKAQMKDVKPGSYYLFGITKTRNGYAIWSSPVAIQTGDNKLVLDPVRMTEINQ